MVCKSIRGRGKQLRRKKRKVPLPRVPVRRGISKPVPGAGTRAGNPGVCGSSGTLKGKWWNPSEALCCPLIFHKDLNTPEACTWTSGYLITSPPSPASEPEEQDGPQEKSFIHLIYKVKTKTFFFFFLQMQNVFVYLQEVV